jgi:hypothetical protein
LSPAIRYDVSDVESSGGEQAPPKIYKGKITAVEHRTEKSDGTKIEGKGDLHITVSIGDNYAALHSYVGLYPATAWKLREFIDAIGLKDKGSIDPTKLVGKECRVQVVKDEYEGAYKARLKTWLAPKDDTEEEDEEPDPDNEPEAEEPEEEEPEAEEEPEEEEEVEPEEEEEPEPEDDGDADDGLDDLDRTELKAILKEEEIEFKVFKSTDTEEIRAAIREARDGDNYDEWSLADLKDEMTKRSLKLEKGTKATSKNIIEALRSDDNEDAF